MRNDTFPVILGICLDAEALWFGKVGDGEHRPVLFSQGAYAIREGLNPLLDLLDKHSAPATFFVPGTTAEHYPEAVRAVAARGHELGGHGYEHRSVSGLTREEESDELVRGNDAVERVAGQRPTTWRSPSWEFSRHTLDLLIAEGLSCSTNFQDRSRPYRHECDGQPLPLVELPVHWHLADAPFFAYGGLPGRVIQPTENAYAVWRDEFDALYEDRPGTFFHLTLHVQLIGHPGRLRMLDRLLRKIGARSRATFMRSIDLAAQVP